MYKWAGLYGNVEEMYLLGARFEGYDYIYQFIWTSIYANTYISLRIFNQVEPFSSQTILTQIITSYAMIL